MISIDYFMSHGSPWTFLGHGRLGVLIKKFNESFANPKTYRYKSISLENVKFFVTSEKDEFSNKVKFWLGFNKEIRLVNLRSNV